MIGLESSGTVVDLTAATVEPDRELLRAAWTEVLGGLDELASGHGYAPLGLPALRHAVADHLCRRGLPTEPDEVLVTSGAQQAIGLAFALFAGPGDAVALESPTYPGAIDAAVALGTRLVPVAVDEGGARPDALREAVARTSPRLAYVVPTFHNPTGALMPETRRREFAALAAEVGLPVIEDLTLADLWLEAAPPAPIAAHARGGQILTIGSMSKLFWAGLRVGWIRAPEPVIDRLARLKIVADLGSALPSQAIAARLLPRVEEARERRARELAASRELLAELLGALLPDWSYRLPAGGLTLWLRLPWGDAEELAQLAARQGVLVVPGPIASPQRGHRDHVRLPLLREPDVLEEGVRLLAQAWHAYRRAGRAADRPVLSVVV